MPEHYRKKQWADSKKIQIERLKMGKSIKMKISGQIKTVWTYPKRDSLNSKMDLKKFSRVPQRQLKNLKKMRGKKWLRDMKVK